MEIATKNNLWHCSCCHRYLDIQNKTKQRLHKKRVHMDFSWKVCQIYSVPFTMILILYFQYCYYVFDTKQLLSLGTQQGIFWWFMTQIKQLFQIQELHSMTYFLDDHSDKIYTNIFAIYLILWIKPYIHACVLCYFEWQSPITLSK